MRTAGASLCAAAALFAAAVPSVAADTQPPARVHLLDVPYLPQSEELCGGAAVAMVMRFWGASGIYADTFASLLDPLAGGIHGADLVRTLQERGWQALSFKGDLPLVRTELEKGRPLIALIEDRPGRFHYVVIVSAYAGRVIVHDPARAPYRVLDEPAFARAWERSGFWTLLALPPAPAAAPAPARAAPAGAGAPAGPCDPIVEQGVRLANAGNTDEARRVLEFASATCPAAAAPWRERAGLHALHDEWRDAAADARQALQRDPHDEYAARILATSLFVEGDTRGALGAWNVAGEPKIDLITVHGLERTRYAVVAHALSLAPRTLLTPASLHLAERRLDELPTALVTRVNFRPAADGLAKVDAVVVERPLIPSSAVPIASIGLRALTDRELAASIASPTGGGELLSASWRWWEHRPRIGVMFAAPASGALHGVWRVNGFNETQTYGPVVGPISERRRGGALQLADWATGQLRWAASAGVDRWIGRGISVEVSGEAQVLAFGDTVSTAGRVALVRGAMDTWTAGGGTEWRSRTRNEGDVLVARAGIDAAGEAAPLALWPGAGTGQGREVLLRAHPLLHDGIISQGVFGRVLLHAGAEWRRWFQAARHPVRIAPALFLDSARASRSTTSFDTGAEMDAGAGIRVSVPGAGVLRIDLAHGLRSGGTVLSLGWTR